MNLISNESLLPFDFVLFGGTGDLSLRKLIPALYFRHCEKQLPEDGRVIGIGRTDVDTEGFRDMLRESVPEHIAEQDLMSKAGRNFCSVSIIVWWMLPARKVISRLSNC